MPSFFRLNVVVRPGGFLSSPLFVIFVDDLVSRVKSAIAGCCLSFYCWCVFLYADDILLLTTSATGLQLLFKVYETECDIIHVDKSCSTIRFCSKLIEPSSARITKHERVIHWACSCTDLGVTFVSGRFFRWSLDDTKSCFFRAFNAVFGEVGHCALDPVLLGLMRVLSLFLFCCTGLSHVHCWCDKWTHLNFRWRVFLSVYLIRTHHQLWRNARLTLAFCNCLPTKNKICKFLAEMCCFNKY